MRMLAPSQLPPLPPLSTLDDREDADEHESKDSTASISSLPPELLLEIIPRVAYSPPNISALRQTSPRLRSLIQHHETSLVRAINEIQHRCSPSQQQQSHQLFPSLHLKDFAALDILHGRLCRLDALHAEWLHITSYGPELAWLRGRWETIHKAGLLLLYRLQDVNRGEAGPTSYHTSPNNSQLPSTCSPGPSADAYTPHYPTPAAVALLDSLPAPALACLLFKLVSSVKILRIHGAAPIHGTYAAGDLLVRSDVELASEEMLLLHGPEWFLGMLRAGKKGKVTTSIGKGGNYKPMRVDEDDGQWAVDLLNSEIQNFSVRQQPDPLTNLPRPATLTSRLRRAFAARTGNAPLVENMGKMWELLAAPVWDCVDEEMLGRVVAGEALVVRRAGRSKEVVAEKGRRSGEGEARPAGSVGSISEGRGRCGSSSSESSRSTL